MGFRGSPIKLTGEFLGKSTRGEWLNKVLSPVSSAGTSGGSSRRNRSSPPRSRYAAPSSPRKSLSPGRVMERGKRDRSRSASPVRRQIPTTSSRGATPIPVLPKRRRLGDDQRSMPARYPPTTSVPTSSQTSHAGGLIQHNPFSYGDRDQSRMAASKLPRTEAPGAVAVTTEYSRREALDPTIPSGRSLTMSRSRYSQHSPRQATVVSPPSLLSGTRPTTHLHPPSMRDTGIPAEIPLHLARSAPQSQRQGLASAAFSTLVPSHETARALELSRSIHAGPESTPHHADPPSISRGPPFVFFSVRRPLGEAVEDQQAPYFLNETGQYVRRRPNPVISEPPISTSTSHLRTARDQAQSLGIMPGSTGLQLRQIIDPLSIGSTSATHNLPATSGGIPGLPPQLHQYSSRIRDQATSHAHHPRSSMQVVPDSTHTLGCSSRISRRPPVSSTRTDEHPQRFSGSLDDPPGYSPLHRPHKGTTIPHHRPTPQLSRRLPPHDILSIPGFRMPIEDEEFMEHKVLALVLRSSIVPLCRSLPLLPDQQVSLL